jgi:hypothetical protein
MSSVSDCELSSISILSIPPPIKKNHINFSKPSLYNKLCNWDILVYVVCTIIVIMFIITLITLFVGMAGVL